MTVYRSEPDVGITTSGIHIAPRPRRRRMGLLFRWLLTLIVLVLLLNLLFVESYTNAGFAPDGQAGQAPDSAVPAAVREGGPVIDTTAGTTPRSRRPQPATIALTFDDGPDPRWTPKVLEILRRHRVHATFFLIGSQVSRHPEVARQVVADGNEVGAHTFTHPELSAIPAWRRSLEYSQTQMALAAAAGVTTSLMRPPYSSEPDALDNATWPTVREAGRQGYLVVLNDLDTNDWQRPGVAKIVTSATPKGDAGAVVLMHDAGGDRSETLTALDRYIPLMQQRGYRFVTVSEAMGDPPRAANPAATSAQVWRGRALEWSVHVADWTMLLLWGLLLVVGGLTLLRTLLLFLFAVHHARRRRASTWSWGVPVTEGVSVIVPAFNERTNIAAAVRSLALSAHRDVEVVVVDDSSTDGTADVVQALGLGNVRVVRVPPGGKAIALNTGVALARHDLIVMVDADTVVEPDSIHRLVQPFAEPTVGAIAGNVKVGNRRTMLSRWQHIEYVIGFNLDRRLYDTLGCIPTIPGALGGFRRQALAEAGGLSLDTIAEDTDLTMAIHRAGWRVVYEESARAYTEAPATLSQLWKQRYRWSYGTMQAMWKHRHAVVERGPSGRFGRLGLPFIVLFTVVLPMLAPLLDMLVVYGAFFLNRWQTIIGWLAVLVIQIITAILAFRLDREPLRALWVLPLQQFAYRQVMYLVLLQSLVTAMTGRRLHWQKLHRSGEVAVPASG